MSNVYSAENKEALLRGIQPRDYPTVILFLMEHYGPKHFYCIASYFAEGIEQKKEQVFAVRDSTGTVRLWFDGNEQTLKAIGNLDDCTFTEVSEEGRKAFYASNSGSATVCDDA